MRLSFSALNQYMQCGRRYDLHYNKRLRIKVGKGALLFGSAMDHALNHLLKTRNLDESISLFKKSWSYQNINDVGEYLPYSTKVVYGPKDYDGDLIFEQDSLKFLELFKEKFSLNTDKSLKQLTAFYRELKKEKGFDGLIEDQKRVYNYGHWVCMFNKGLLMIQAYNAEIMPKIKEVLSVQESFSIENNAGDSIPGFIDMVVRWEDGNVYIMDNKTSGSEYDDDAASKSPQLITYLHARGGHYKAIGVGFNVLYKQIDKNKKKTCSLCQYNGSEGRHKTCPNELEGKRCNGAWIETIDPKARVQYILNKVSSFAEDLVLDAFDEAVSGIKAEVFNPNLQACGDGEWRCQFYDKCWKGDESDLIKLEKTS